MAQPTNTFDRYDAIGVKEDLSDVIYNVDPSETPFFSGCRKTKASQTFHEWQTDSLRSSAANAKIEGDTIAAAARSATVRLGNYTQIFSDAFVISGTLEATDAAGRASETAYQKMKVGKEIRLDIEKALLDNNAKVAGSSTVARELAGVPSWINTNTSLGASGADPTGDGTDARTDGTQRAFSETDFNTVLQEIWEAGGNPDTVMLSAANQKLAADFEGNAPRRLTDVESGGTYNFVDFYVTNWGQVKFVPSREIRARDVMILDTEGFEVAELRPMFSQKLAKTADAETYDMRCELTLVSKNEKSSGGVFDTGA